MECERQVWRHRRKASKVDLLEIKEVTGEQVAQKCLCIERCFVGWWDCLYGLFIWFIYTFDFGLVSWVLCFVVLRAVSEIY